MGHIADGIANSWPKDLFHPIAGQQQHSKIMPLPDGGLGKISITVDAKLREETGIMQSLERVIITETGGQQRESHEIWTLTHDK